jgi:hypothetical protein
MKTLQLPLKTAWFEMTEKGIKVEDYRAITPYWCNRLLLCDEANMSKKMWADMLLSSGVYSLKKHTGGIITFKTFTNNVMTLGYPKASNSRRILKYKHKRIEIRVGNPEWGAEPGTLYFVIVHGDRIG